MPETQRRYFLKEKEAKSLLKETPEKLKIIFEQMFKGKASFEVVETSVGKIFLVDDDPVMFNVGGLVFPTLLFERFLMVTPKIVVDMGAVPYVCKGANVMAPGIRRFEGEFVKGDIVQIVDEKHDKTIATGKAFHSFQDAKNLSQGVVVENVHFVGDKIWSLMKNLVKKNR